MSKKKVMELRDQIDIIDSKLIKLLEKRVALGKEIIKFKEKVKLPKEDLKREQEIVENLTYKSSIDKKTINMFYKIIFKMVKSK